MIDMIEKIFGKLRQKLAIFLLRLAARTANAGLAARVLAGVAWHVPELPLPSGRKRSVVLCLGRTIFVDDIRALAKYSGKLEYAVVHLNYWDALFKSFFSRRELRTITEINYHHGQETQSGKVRYADFLRRVWPFLVRRLQLRAVLSGNFDYLVQQEIERVAEEMKTPFIILHKEGLVGFGGAEFAAPYKHFRFLGSKALLYNEKAKSTLLSAWMPGLSEDKIEVVGAPRLDIYFKKTQIPPERKQIVLFSFSVDDRFHYLAGHKEKIEQLKKRASDFHRWVMDVAAKHPEFQIIIKTKNAAHYGDYVSRILQANFPKFLSNLVITNSANPQLLIANAQAILGYNSTTLIEGLLAGKLVVSPDFSDLIPPESTDFFQGYPDLINLVRSSEQLDRVLCASREDGEINIERREKFLREYIHIPDGQASQRAEDAIIQAINQKSAPAGLEKFPPKDRRQPSYFETDHI